MRLIHRKQNNMAQKKFIIDAGFKANGDSIVEGNLNVNSTPTEGSHAVNKAYVDAQIAANSTPSWGEVTTNATIAANSKNLVDTTSALTITLPASPTIGTEVMFIDASGQAATNNITVNGNGEKIQGLAEDLIINVDRAAFQVVYHNTANGWVFMEV